MAEVDLSSFEHTRADTSQPATPARPSSRLADDAIVAVNGEVKFACIKSGRGSRESSSYSDKRLDSTVGPSERCNLRCDLS